MSKTQVAMLCSYPCRKASCFLFVFLVSIVTKIYLVPLSVWNICVTDSSGTDRQAQQWFVQCSSKCSVVSTVYNLQQLSNTYKNCNISKLKLIRHVLFRTHRAFSKFDTRRRKFLIFLFFDVF